MSTFYKKTILSIALFSIIFSVGVFFFPSKSEALGPEVALAVPVGELYSIPMELKEGPYGAGFGWDTIGYILAKIVLSTVTNSIVNWINSGFEGNPTFVDPDTFLRDVADQASGAFIQQLGLEGVLCSPFRLPILASLKLSYKVPTMPRFQCTLDAAKENWQRNWDEFMYDFTSGGWDRWLTVTTQPQNNPYGAYLMAADEMQSRRAAAKEKEKMEVSWGSGFVSLQKCSGDIDQEKMCDTQCSHLEDPDDCVNSCMEIEGWGEGLNTAEKCKLSGGQMKNTTPGAIIADQIKLNLGSSVRQMELADEISESLAAIFNALVNQLIGSGLSSLTSGGGGSGDWYKTPPTSKEKENIVKMIDNSIKSEIDYRNAKQQSLDKYNWAIGKVQELINCYQNQGGMQNVINNQLIPLLNNLNSQKQAFESAVQYSNYLISQAEDLKYRVQQANTYEKLSELLKEFQDDLQPNLHNSSDAAAAKEEYNNVVKPAIDNIINGSGGIQDLLDQCLAGTGI